MVMDSSPRRFRRQRRSRALLAAPLLAFCGLVALAGDVYGGGTSTVQHVKVAPGDSLWSIAASAYPDGDVRDRVNQIIEINHLDGGVIHPGQSLTLPAA